MLNGFRKDFVIEKKYFFRQFKRNGAALRWATERLHDDIEIAFQAV
jgi:hypothetical protein